MIALGIWGESLLLWPIYRSILILLCSLMIIQPAYAGSPIDSIDWLLKMPPDQSRVVLRLTSVDAVGKRRITRAALHYSRDNDAQCLMATIGGKDQPGSDFCLRCGAAGILTPCEVQTGSFPESTDELIPGTLLPWGSFTLSFCHQFSAQNMEQSSDSRHDVVEFLPCERDGKTPESKLRVFVSKTTRLPEQIVQVDRLGRELSTVEIHKIRKTSWGPAVIRSTYLNPHTRARVLIEVCSGSVNVSDGTEERTSESYDTDSDDRTSRP